MHFCGDEESILSNFEYIVRQYVNIEALLWHKIAFLYHRPLYHVLFSFVICYVYVL